MLGPRPPAVGGGAVSVETLLNHLREYPNLDVRAVNTAPSGLGRPTDLLRFETVRRALAIIRDYWQVSRGAYAAILFGANQTTAYLAPILWLMSRIRGVRFFIKPLGGDLGLYLAQCPSPIRWSTRFVLARVDGVLPQTVALRNELLSWGCRNVVHVPGFRAGSPDTSRPQNVPGQLRLIYLAHIRLEKGPLLLLSALKRLRDMGIDDISCDFFGPLFADVEGMFQAELATTDGAQYRGVWDSHADTVQLLAEYDALVLPTHYPGEGQPGVIVEAMIAGLPVVATRHGGIPELVRHRENGLLVPCQDLDLLTEALLTLRTDPKLRARLARTSRELGAELKVGAVVPRMFQQILPDLLEGASPPKPREMAGTGTVLATER